MGATTAVFIGLGANLGLLLAKQPERGDEAEVAYRKAIELAPTDYAPWNNLGLLLVEQPERAEAADTGEHALAHGLFGQRFDALDQGVACVDVNASVFVRQGGRSGCGPATGEG